MSSDDAASRRPAGAAAPSARWSLQHRLDRWLFPALARAWPRGTVGRLQVTLPSGAAGVLGSGEGSLGADIAVASYRLLWRLATRGAVGFADSYLRGEWSSDDVERLLHHYMANESRLAPRLMSVVGSSWSDRISHRLRANTRAGSRRNISAHYDLGNAFYRLWLDEGMTYSSGIYRCEGDTLEVAQAEKYARILEALELGPGHELLEIGCGWGALAEAAANAGARVSGITISAEQLAWARARIAAAGLAERATLRFEDYRDTLGRFDRIASIEMIEAVGEENWATYFRTVADRLRPGGLAVIQAITIRPDLYEGYRRNPDFIQRYIFPGGMLPTVARMQEQAHAAGLAFETVETFGLSYAHTLRDWQRRFDAAWPRIEALGFDERFRRMWRYYLAYCAVGFACGSIDVGLYRLRRPAA